MLDRSHQGFVGGSLGEGVDNIDVLEVGQPVALSQKARDIVPRGLLWLLSTIVKVPWVSRMYISALEISHENLFQVCLALDAPRAKAIESDPR